MYFCCGFVRERDDCPALDNKCKNYRTVSLTNFVCKVMESIIWGQIVDGLARNALISNSLLSFVKGRSTSLQLTSVLNDLPEEVTLILSSATSKRLLTKYLNKDIKKFGHRRSEKKSLGGLKPS